MNLVFLKPFCVFKFFLNTFSAFVILNHNFKNEGMYSLKHRHLVYWLKIKQFNKWNKLFEWLIVFYRTNVHIKDRPYACRYKVGLIGYRRGRNPLKRIIKSINDWCRILEQEKTYSTSFPFIHSLFIMYLLLEGINVLLKYT